MTSEEVEIKEEEVITLKSINEKLKEVRSDLKDSIKDFKRGLDYLEARVDKIEQEKKNTKTSSYERTETRYERPESRRNEAPGPKYGGMVFSPEERARVEETEKYKQSSDGIPFGNPKWGFIGSKPK